MAWMNFQDASAEQNTLPLSAVEFRSYLATYQLELLDVALKSGVRYMTVWRIVQGQPIHSQNELLVRQGLMRMTGIPYTAPLLIREETEEANNIYKGKRMSSVEMEWKER